MPPLTFHETIEQFVSFCHLGKTIYVFWLRQRMLKNLQDHVTRFYAPVAGNELLSQVYTYVYMCTCVQHITRARMYCGRQSRVLVQRIPLDGTSTQILAFERTQISDKSCTNRHSRNGLLEVHQGRPGMSNVPVRHPPGNTCLALQEKRPDGITVKMDFRSLRWASTWPFRSTLYKNRRPAGQN